MDNHKQNLLDKLLEAVVDSCSTPIDNQGTMSITKEDVLGKCRRDSVVMTRTMLANQLRRAGFTADTIGMFLHRSPQEVRKLCQKESDFIQTSCAYCVAFSQATIKCNEVMNEMLKK